jgi:hypothetical protein
MATWPTLNPELSFSTRCHLIFQILIDLNQCDLEACQ